MTYAYDAANRLTSETTTGAGAGTVTYAYDNGGNLLTKKQGTTTLQSYTYDAWNRTASVTTGVITTAMLYDGFGRRFSKDAIRHV